jgi:hypothetical protein
MENEYNFLLELLKSLPHWFVMFLIGGVFIKKYFCDGAMKTLLKILIKWKYRDEKKDKEQDMKREAKDKEQDLRLDKIENTLETNKEQRNRMETKIDDIMEFLTKEK